MNTTGIDEGVDNKRNNITGGELAGVYLGWEVRRVDARSSTAWILLQVRWQRCMWAWMEGTEISASWEGGLVTQGALEWGQACRGTREVVVGVFKLWQLSTPGGWVGGGDTAEHSLHLLVHSLCLTIVLGMVT